MNTENSLLFKVVFIQSMQSQGYDLKEQTLLVWSKKKL